MDRDEIAVKRQQSPYANSAEVSETDSPSLPGIAGREDNMGADPASDSRFDVAQPVGAVPRGEITGAHQPGTGANETADGLSGTEEAVRQAAEGETEPYDFEELPVFDRADAIPKII
jgi:hypothetical protein